MAKTDHYTLIKITVRHQ